MVVIYTVGTLHYPQLNGESGNKGGRIYRVCFLPSLFFSSRQGEGSSTELAAVSVVEREGIHKGEPDVQEHSIARYAYLCYALNFNRLSFYIPRTLEIDQPVYHVRNLYQFNAWVEDESNQQRTTYRWVPPYKLQSTMPIARCGWDGCIRLFAVGFKNLLVDHGKKPSGHVMKPIQADLAAYGRRTRRFRRWLRWVECRPYRGTCGQAVVGWELAKHYVHCTHLKKVAFAGSPVWI